MSSSALDFARLPAAAAALECPLTEPQVEAFRRLHQLLLEVGQHTNLTRLLDEADFLEGHVLDSLTLVPHLDGRRSLVDVGSGAGFPALPLAVALPRLEVTAIEATRKKVRFIERAIDELALEDRVSARRGRAEDLAHDEALRGRFECATGRAVGELSTVAELTLPFLQPGGMLLAQRGEEAEQETEAAAGALEMLGAKVGSVKPVAAQPFDDRYLVLIEKMAATPEKYPRRPGIPKKRPL